MAGSNSLGTIRGTIEIDYDGAGIVKAVRDTDKLKDSGDRLNRSMTGILRTFGSFAKAAAIVGASSFVTNSGLQAVAATLAIIGPLAAAGIATLPGIMLGAAAASVVLKIATAGVGDALSAASEDATKFNKAIEGLSPEARKFAQAYRAALPALNAVKSAIQDAFFRNTAGQVNKVVKAVASLRPQAVGIAGAMGRLAQDVVRFVTSSQNIERIRQILSGTNAFLIRMRGALKPIIDGFLNLAAQASAFGGTLGGVVASALQRFGQFLQGINLQELFAKAQPIVQALGVFLQNIASIAGNLFSVFNVDGANAAGILGELAGKLAEFLNSAEGQAALAAVGQAMQAISSGAGQIFLALLQALAPTLVALAPGITELANSLTALLVPAIQALTPLLVATAGFISDNIGVIGPLAGLILAVAAAYKVYTAVTKAWAAAEAVAQALRLKAVATWVANTAATVANTAVTAANAAIRGGAFLASWIATTAAMVAQRVAMVAMVAIMGVIRAATIAWTAVQWALNAAMLANPLGLIIIAVIALIAVIVLLWTKSETFRTIVLAVWAAIKVAIKAAIDFIIAYYTFWFNVGKAIFNAIKSFILAVWSGIVAGLRAYINAIRTVVTTVFNFIKAYITAVFNAYKTIAITVWNAIVSVIRAAINRVMAAIQLIQRIVAIVRNAFNSARNAASNAINSLLSLVRGIPGRVSSALGNLGRLLYEKGRALIRGFIDGIKSMISAAANAAKNVVGAVTRFLPGSPAKEGPLSGQGYVYLRARRFMADFAKGLSSTSQLPVNAIRGAVRPIVALPPFMGPVKPSVRQRSTKVEDTTRPSTFGPYQMEVDGKVLTSFVIDAVTGNPVPVAAAAQEGSRQRSWTNTGRS